ISHGIKELQEGGGASEGRIRRKGGGRKKTVSKQPSLREDLERLVEPVTLDEQECAQAGQGTAPARPSGLPSVGQRVVARTGLQLAGQPQDGGSRCAVRASQCPGTSLPGGGRTGHLRRCQEEGTGGRVQEWRTRMASCGRTG